MRNVGSNRFPHGVFNNGNELLDAKRLFDAGNPSALERGCSVLVGDVPSDEYETRSEFGAVTRYPVVDVGAIDSARCTHVRDYAEEFSRLELAQAFGTGSHASTALCIELLEEIDLRKARALDIGCGTGILSLAMLLLGARKVIGFDIDRDTIGAMEDNRRRNRTPASFFIGTLDSLRPSLFDVVTMNILPEVIVPLLPSVSRHVRGSLILSGILRRQRDEIVGGLRLVSERENGEWWAGRFTP